MALNFPHREEVRLSRPPLAEVICQMRFPAILGISKDEPSDFQRLIRAQFPEFTTGREVLLRDPGVEYQVGPSAEFQPRVHRFQTPDRGTTVSLSEGFFALSTERYEHWETFAGYLGQVLEAVSQVYSPAYATRIGLRYVNRLTLANTGAQGAAGLWRMLRPELTILANAEPWNEPANMFSQLLLNDDEAQLALRTAFGTEDEPFLLLDFDYFEEGRMALASLLPRTERYHTRIYDAFRWCVPDEALQAFGPSNEEHP
jgi:uncharacterized protein (TIGR04255 family)